MAADSAIAEEDEDEGDVAGELIARIVRPRTLSSRRDWTASWPTTIELDDEEPWAEYATYEANEPHCQQEEENAQLEEEIEPPPRR